MRRLCRITQHCLPVSCSMLCFACTYESVFRSSAGLYWSPGSSAEDIASCPGFCNAAVLPLFLMLASDADRRSRSPNARRWGLTLAAGVWFGEVEVEYTLRGGLSECGTQGNMASKRLEDLCKGTRHAGRLCTQSPHHQTSGHSRRGIDLFSYNFKFNCCNNISHFHSTDKIPWNLGVYNLLCILLLISYHT